MAATAISLRLDADTLERWRAAAKDRGVPLAELIRQSVEHEVGVASVTITTPVVERSTSATPTRTRVKATRAACAKAHFHKKGVYCKHCGQIP